MRRSASASASRLTIALQENVLTRVELFRLLQRAGYQARALPRCSPTMRRDPTICIRCRDRRDAVRLAFRLERVPGVAVASLDRDVKGRVFGG